MSKRGLQPLVRDVKETYHGISDDPISVTREAEVPLGFQGMNTSACFHIADGSGSQLPGLASCPDLQRWNSVLHLRNMTLEMRELGGSTQLHPVNGQLMAECGDFGEDHLADPKLQRFVKQLPKEAATQERRVFGDYVFGSAA